MPDVNLNKVESIARRQRPAALIDRDLSLVEFQRRVFDEARDEQNPLLERVRFLGIVSSNIDEFGMVRAPELRETAGGAHWEKVRKSIVALMREARVYFQEQLVPQLAAAGL